jgi:hypothetical protein
MMLSLAPLLLHEADVPPRARNALLAASLAPAGERRAHLEVAARALAYEANLDCEDARELVGLAATYVDR